ncbi:MAG: hypothetical protein ACYSTZ_10840 [Planctomycetota bacterium]
MRDENLERMLSELGERAGERVRPDLAEEIKAHIPEHLHAHRRGLDTINIVIDLRVGKLAAAAAIIITMILLANIHGLYRDGKVLARYFMGGPNQSDILTGKAKYDLLVKNGEEVVLYGEIGTQDSNAVRMHWKVSQDKYKVIFGDMREAKVSAEELIRLQARMLQETDK